ncbi:MAG: DUF4215 domain-containing protein [Ferruginibacter sp.]
MRTKICTLFLLTFISFTVFAGDGFLNFLKNDPAKKEQQLYIFYRSDCPYCQQMNTAIEQDAAFQKALTQNYSLTVLDIQSPEGKALANQFNVHAVPTLVKYNSTNGNVDITKGFGSLNRLSKALQLNYQSAVAEKLPPVYNTPGICGNGVVESGEVCDDGNLNDFDGCTNVCTIQIGFSCSGSPSVCSTVCGDGLKAGAETCDDGNAANGDGCSATCATETGYSCFGIPSICTSVCGDGIVANDEACDDGNVALGDGCTNACAVEVGYNCTGSPSVCTLAPPTNDNCLGATTLSSVSGTISGDNTLATNSGVVGATCRPAWQKDVWYMFTLTAARPISIAVNAGTMSDPVLALYNGSCVALTEVGCDDDNGPGNSSLWTGNLMPGTYYLRVMGFGLSGSSGIGTFNVVYSFNTAICGNNVVDFGESCDDGNLTNGDGCSATCTFETNASNPSKGVAINLDATVPNPAAILDVKSDSKGILIPRLTSAQRSAIVGPVNGLTVFDVTTNSFWYYKSTAWFEISNAYNTGFCAINANPQAFSSQFQPIFVTKQFDDGNNFSTTTNSFTTSSNAVYNLNADASFNLINVTAQTIITLIIEDKTTFTRYSSSSIIVPAGFTGTLYANTSSQAKITTGTNLGVRILVVGTLGNQSLSSITFCGSKIY